MGNYTLFRCSKMLGEAGKQEILLYFALLTGPAPNVWQLGVQKAQNL